MNNRVKQIWEDSEEIIVRYPKQVRSVSVTEQTLEKFAELIVRECMNTIKQNENASLNISNFTDEKKQGIQLGLEFAITDIAEHFGVEE